MSASVYSLQIAGLGFELCFEDGLPSGFPDAAHRAFWRDCPPDVRLRFVTGKMPAWDLSGAEPLFKTAGLWSAFVLGERRLIRIGLPNSGGPPYRMALFDADFRRGEIYTDPDADSLVQPHVLANPLSYPLGELIMIGLLARDVGILVHAAGVDDNGDGLLFVGHSGNGKTTLARLWEGEGELLNDDRIVVRERNGRFWMYGTPWHGEHTVVRSGGVPVSRILFIEHGSDNRLRPCKLAAAAPMLLARCFPPFWDAAGMGHSLELCGRLAAAVPTQRLEFVPGGNVVLAAFENDFLVRDPDTSIAGTQIVHLTVPDPADGNDIQIDTSFKVTGALTLYGPGADGPEAVDPAALTFTWQDYSSEDFYALMVYNTFGNEVWAVPDVPRVTGGGNVEVDYAGPALTPGMYYQWRATSQRDTGPISTTEDLLGVFYVPGSVNQP